MGQKEKRSTHYNPTITSLYPDLPKIIVGPDFCDITVPVKLAKVLETARAGAGTRVVGQPWSTEVQTAHGTVQRETRTFPAKKKKKMQKGRWQSPNPASLPYPNWPNRSLRRALSVPLRGGKNLERYPPSKIPFSYFSTARNAIHNSSRM